MKKAWFWQACWSFNHSHTFWLCLVGVCKLWPGCQILLSRPPRLLPKLRTELFTSQLKMELITCLAHCRRSCALPSRQRQEAPDTPRAFISPRVLPVQRRHGKAAVPRPCLKLPRGPASFHLLGFISSFQVQHWMRNDISLLGRKWKFVGLFTSLCTEMQEAPSSVKTIKKFLPKDSEDKTG